MYVINNTCKTPGKTTHKYYKRYLFHYLRHSFIKDTGYKELEH